MRSMCPMCKSWRTVLVPEFDGNYEGTCFDCDQVFTVTECDLCGGEGLMPANVINPNLSPEDDYLMDCPDCNGTGVRDDE